MEDVGFIVIFKIEANDSSSWEASMRPKWVDGKYDGYERLGGDPFDGSKDVVSKFNLKYVHLFQTREEAETASKSVDASVAEFTKTMRRLINREFEAKGVDIEIVQVRRVYRQVVDRFERIAA
jgi:hypothetical protein